MTQLTKRQAAIIGAYTGVLCGPFSEMLEYIGELLGYPVPDLALADVAVADAVRDASREDFFAIARGEA